MPTLFEVFGYSFYKPAMFKRRSYYKNEAKELKVFIKP
jgi:hypothetical protein